MISCPNCQKKWYQPVNQCECGRFFAFASSHWGISDQEFMGIIEETEESQLKEPLYYTMHQLLMTWRKNRFRATYQSESKLLLALNSIFWIYYFENIYLTYGFTFLALLSWFKFVQKPLIYLFKLRIIRFLSVIFFLFTISWIYFHFKISYHIIPICILSFAAMVERIYSKSQSSYDDFLAQFQRWKKLHGFARLIEKPQLQTPKPELQESLYEYDINDILLVEQDLLVDFLVKNGFHKRHKILILSFQAYPRYSALQLRRLMSDLGAEKITVFIYHKEHTTPQSLKETLQHLGIQRIGKKQAKVIYLGVTPRDQQKISDWIDVPRPVTPVLSAFELLKPKQILSVLDQCITQRVGIHHASIKPRNLKEIDV